MDVVKSPLKYIANYIDVAFEGKEPWKIVTITTGSVLLVVWLYDFVDRDESVATRTKRTGMY